MAITQKQLAEMFELSQMTISRALRGQPGVNEKLRDRILKAARKHGYSAETHHAARMLRYAGRDDAPEVNVICAMVPETTDDDQFSFHGRILNGIRAGAAETGVEVIMATHQVGALPLVVSRGQVDGVVRLVGATNIRSGQTACPLPWVSILFDVAGVDSVTIDNFSGARAVGRHLCELGHRRLAYIGSDNALSLERLAGLRAAAAGAGAAVPEELTILDPWASGSSGNMRQLLSRLPEDHYTAIVTYNDHMAMTAIAQLETQGRRIPEHLSIAGFDSALPRGYRNRTLTTAAVPLEALGKEAMRVLAARLRDRDAPRRRLTLETKLVIGNTTAAPTK